MNNKCSHNWDRSSLSSCGSWGQVHMGAGSDWSQSWPHTAHSASRDLPKVIGGPPGEVSVSCDTDSRGLRKIVLSLLFMFHCVLLFYYFLKKFQYTYILLIFTLLYFLLFLFSVLLCFYLLFQKFCVSLLALFVFLFLVLFFIFLLFVSFIFCLFLSFFWFHFILIIYLQFCFSACFLFLSLLSLLFIFGFIFLPALFFWSCHGL